MEPFWNTQKLAKILAEISSAPTNAAPSQPILSITTDSRAVAPGCLFIALPGDQFDGHDFIAAAIEKGAVAILSEKPFAGKVPVFQVRSSLEAIRKLAAHYRSQFTIPVVGVVGSVGKTTTKELISSLLLGKYSEVLKTEGSQNGFLGIPLTLLRLQPRDEVAVIEIGIDDIGAMAQHLELVKPTHLVLTAIGPEHLHQLKTVAVAAEEELKAFDYAVEKKLPIAVNLSDEFVASWYQKHQFSLADKLNKTYAMRTSSAADFIGAYHSEKSILSVTAGTETIDFHLPLPGEHHALNLLAAITLTSFLDVSSAEMKTGLAQFKTAYGRTELYTLPNDIHLIGDYYNSNPTSVKAALKLLKERKTKGVTHAVLGDMLELGDHEERFHRELALLIEENAIHSVWLYGERMKWLLAELQKRGFKNAQHYGTHEELQNALLPATQAGDQILVKGSRGMKMETVLKGILAHFDHKK